MSFIACLRYFSGGGGGGGGEGAFFKIEAVKMNPQN